MNYIRGDVWKTGRRHWTCIRLAKLCIIPRTNTVHIVKKVKKEAVANLSYPWFFATPFPHFKLSLCQRQRQIWFIILRLVFFFNSKDWENQFHLFNRMALHEQQVFSQYPHKFPVLKINYQVDIIFKAIEGKTFATNKRARQWVYGILNLFKVTATLLVEQKLVLHCSKYLLSTFVWQLWHISQK